MPTYVVTPHEGETYEVSSDSIIVDEMNSNRVTFIKTNGAIVAQENDAKSVRPK